MIPKSGYRFSVKIMLKLNNLATEDRNERRHPVAQPPIPRPRDATA
jgi:hypothetical protein